MFFLPLLLSAVQEIESLEPVSPYYKKGAWTSVVVEIQMPKPWKGFLAAIADSNVTFAVPVDFPSGGKRTLTLPVYFCTDYASLTVRLESDGQKIAEKSLDTKLTPLRNFDVIVVAGPSADIQEGHAEDGPRKVKISRFDFSSKKLQVWGGEALESIDVLVDPPKSEDLTSWLAWGGQVVSAHQFDPRKVHNRVFLWAQSNFSGAAPHDLRSYDRRDRSEIVMLAYGLCMLGMLTFFFLRRTQGFSLIIATPILIGAFTIGSLCWVPRKPIVAHVQTVSVGLGDRQAKTFLTFVWTPVAQDALLPLAWMSKPLAEIPLRLVLDPESRSTRVEIGLLKSGNPLGFIGTETVAAPPYPLEGDPTSVENRGGDSLRRLLYTDGDSFSVPIRLAAGAKVPVSISPGAQGPSSLERLLARWYCVQGPCWIAQKEGRRIRIEAPWQLSGSKATNWVEWQAPPAYLIRQIR